MSRYIIPIGSREFIGDSLSSINFNFDNLQTVSCNLCSVLGGVTNFGVNSVVAGPGISVTTFNQEVTASREDCPKWYVNSDKKGLLTETTGTSLAVTQSADFLKHIQDVTNYNITLKSMSTFVSYTTSINNLPNDAFRGGIRMLDGRILLPRFNSASSYIYDYKKNVMLEVGGFGVTSLSAFWGGVVMADGRVFCIPYNNSGPAIYNVNRISSNRVTTIAWPGIVSGAFIGGTMLRDGRVLLSPFNMTQYGIYNPRTNTVSTGALPSSNPRQVYGCCLAPNGKVLFIPYNTTGFWVFQNNTVQTVNNTAPGNEAYRGGVLLHTGEIFCVPYNTTKAAIYNPINDSVRYTGNIFPGVEAYETGVLLPDGRVFLCPAKTNNPVIFDPVTEEIEMLKFNMQPEDYYGCSLLDNNRVMLHPKNANAGAIFSIPCTENFHYAVLSSPFINKT